MSGHRSGGTWIPCHHQLPAAEVLRGSWGTWWPVGCCQLTSAVQPASTSPCPFAGSRAAGVLGVCLLPASSLSLPNREKREAGGCWRALLAVAEATRFKLDKHVLITAVILLPRGILSGRRQTLHGDKEWEKGKEKHDPPVVRESKRLGRQEGCTPRRCFCLCPVSLHPGCWQCRAAPNSAIGVPNPTITPV